MQRTGRISLIAILLMYSTILSSCATEVKHKMENVKLDMFETIEESGKVPVSGSLLHYRNQEYNVGDVHPYYDTKSSTWYMFYLKPGDYASQLLTSKDMLHWTPKEIKFAGAPAQKYYVLGVVNEKGTYRSWFGQGAYMGSSESADLLLWKMGTSGTAIKNDLNTFLAGARDPYVFWDPDEKVYRCVSTSYRTNKDWGFGEGLDCSLALSSTTQADCSSWSKEQQELIHFPDGMKGEPECSQMLKIGNRWYLLASMARRTAHWVGRPSYWIGDENTSIAKDRWQAKEEKALNGEDLCAAQVVNDGNRWLMWGWIPMKWNGGDWGGHLNLPHEVYPLPDGTLATRLESSVSRKIRGGTLAALQEPATLEGDKQVKLDGKHSRFDISASIKLEQESIAAVKIGNEDSSGIVISLDGTNHSIGIHMEMPGGITGQEFASIDVPEGALHGQVEVRAIAEGDMLEVFVNDRWSVCARIHRELKNETVAIQAISGRIHVDKAMIFRLKWLEEMT